LSIPSSFEASHGHFLQMQILPGRGILISKIPDEGNMQLTIPIPEGQETVRFPAGALDWSEEEFFQFCQANRGLRIERSAKGEIIVMSPAGGYSSFESGEAFGQLRTWAIKDGSGVSAAFATRKIEPSGKGAVYPFMSLFRD
jgi:hypothetical protein